MELFEPAIFVVLVLLGFLELGAAFAAARVPLRILGLPQKKAGELAEGRARVEGELVAVSSMPTTLDGVPAVAIDSRLLRADTWHGWRSAQVWADVAVADSTGRCAVDLDGVIMLGEGTRRTVPAEAVATHCPTLWQKCNDSERARAQLHIEQRFLRAGGGFVAGEVAPGRRAAGQGYRDGPRQELVIGSGVSLPLVVASSGKGAVMRHLLGPAFLHAATGLLAFFLAACVLAVDRFINFVAGVEGFWL